MKRLVWALLLAILACNGTPAAVRNISQQELPSTLELAVTEVELSLGDEISIVGFPGDVTDFIEIVPGETVPQATSLSGDITALRTHDDTEAVTADNLDVIQHQVPTTPGTSGSSMVSCGKVIGVNFAITADFDGSNFGVPIRYVRDLLNSKP